MAERFTTLREILRPKIIGWGGSLLVVLGFYDLFCSQFGLPPLKEIISWVIPRLGMTGALMPWWGWFLVLQTVFLYALFEYVRRAQPGVAPEIPRTLETRLIEIEETQAETGRRVLSIHSEVLNRIDAVIQTVAAQGREAAGEREKIYQDLKNAEDARLAQISRIQNEIKPFTDGFKSADLDLLYLLDWARNIESVLVIPLLLELQPVAVPLEPPLNDVERGELQRKMKRWTSEVVSVTQHMPGGDEVTRAMTIAEGEAESEVRRMSPAERPAGVDPIAFQDYFVMAHKCAAAERRLVRILESRRDATLSTMSQLRERYSVRMKPHRPT
jgi:hypothetical protein